MSLPRQVLAGTDYMFTRRCTQRQFLMRPDKETTQAYLYCLAVAAEKHGIEVYFAVAMSNHHHLGGRDTRGNFPDFLQYLHRLFAVHQNALRGRWENFWSSEQTSAVRLVDGTSCLEKMVYALTNPVKDDLVDRAHHWPGFSSLRASLTGATLTVRRPRHFFSPEGRLPETARIRFARPPGCEHMTQDEFAAFLTSQVGEVERECVERRQSEGKRILGRREVRRQRCSDSPTSQEPRRRLNPRVACRDRWRRVEALARNKAFVNEHAAAREAFQRDPSARFPAGTWWYVRFAGARSVPLVPPAPS